MNWYIGQEIVCIDSTPSRVGNNIYLKEGEFYKIMGLDICPCGCKTTRIFVGFTASGKVRLWCYVSKSPSEILAPGNNIFYNESRFAPLLSNEMIAELLEQKINQGV